MKNYTQVYVHNSLEAAKVYCKAFGAEATLEMKTPAGDQYEHCELSVDGEPILALSEARTDYDVEYLHREKLQTMTFNAFELGSEEAMCAFCAGIQGAAPVDSFAAPVPGDMPGYDSQVIMAAGAFVQGSSIELSADGPIRPPYAVYFQGGLTWHHAKLGILLSLQKMVDGGLAAL